MLGRLPRRDPEAALELLVGDIAGIRTEGVDLRDVPRDEDLEAPHVYQVESVGDDAGQKAAVLLIASQLGPAVVLAGDDDFVEPAAFALHVQFRIQPQLPVGVAHVFRYRHLELQPYAAVPLRDISETRRHHSRVYPVDRHHLPAFLVQLGAHYQQLLAVQTCDPQGVSPRRHQPGVERGQRRRHVRRQPQTGGRTFLLEPRELHRRAAGMEDEKQECKRSQKADHRSEAETGPPPCSGTVQPTLHTAAVRDHLSPRACSRLCPWTGVQHRRTPCISDI